jgi:two-component system, NtrC family, sensor histidine kinase HydH
MAGEDRATPRWLDFLWLLFLGGLALLPPIGELHKQIIIFLIGAFQLLESRFIQVVPRGGEALSVTIKLVLATVLMIHTSDVGINSLYYPIYYLAITTAAMYYGPLGTLLWTLLAAGLYCSYLVPALKQFSLDATSIGELSLRIIFFFLIGMIVNRFVMEYRAQSHRYQILAETLSEANQSLKKAQADARRAERLAALGQLSAGLAHEIRNPLGVIKGSAEILNQKLESSDALSKELSSYIYTEVNRLSALVSRFLDFARPSRLQLRAQQLPDLVERSLKYVADQGAMGRVTIHRDYAPGLPPVMLDEELCEQVFINLISNACEAMGDQGGELTLRIHPGAANGRHDIVAVIQDTGPGIPAEMKEQIFNPFVTGKKTGVGLGLAIVSKIVDAHGGTVRVTSEPGHGACFQVSFPQAADHKQPQEIEQHVQ